MFIPKDAPLSHVEYAARAAWALRGVQHEGGTITHKELATLIGAEPYFAVNWRDWGMVLDLVAMDNPALVDLVIRKDGKTPAGKVTGPVDTIAPRSA